MKAFLMFQGRDFDTEQPLPFNAGDLIQDLHLSTLFEAMGGDDRFLIDVAEHAVLDSLTDVGAITYRQDVLDDCLRHASVVRQLYAIAVEAIVGEKRGFFLFLRSSPDVILHRSVQVLEFFIGVLRRLRQVSDAHAAEFRSAGFTAFFAMIEQELDDAYLHTLDDHLRTLQFRDGTLISAQLGTGGKGRQYVLRRPLQRPGWWQRLTAGGPESYTYRIPERDESGARALGELQGRGVNLVANALAQSTDHILAFFTMLRRELAFYIGCLNLHEQLTRRAAATCRPAPRPAVQHTLSCRGLYDVCLTLTAEDATVIGNDIDADDTDLVVITGANQGGKSTLLRAVGLAQLMMQCGMFVGADVLESGVASGVFTHFKREEDTEMNSGKLDEELARMSEIADHVKPDGMVLFNESFAATNEREGSELARQIFRALLEQQIKVIAVTHQYDLAQSLSATPAYHGLFLRAERRDDGRRTFKVLPGEPLPTSFGEDLYRRIFATASADSTRTQD
jgi:MutS domain V